jgi:hypothetical protein
MDYVTDRRHVRLVYKRFLHPCGALCRLVWQGGGAVSEGRSCTYYRFIKKSLCS